MTNTTRSMKHVTTAGPYLTAHLETFPNGDVDYRSGDAQNTGKVTSFVNNQGDASSHQHGPDGHHQQVHDGDHFHHAASHTATHTNGTDVGTAHHRHNAKDGSHEERGSHDTTAINGTNVEASQQSKMTFSDDGNGMHVMKGHQSFITKEGGEFHGVDQDYSLFAKSVVHLNSGADMSIHSDQNVGVTSDANTSIYAAGPITIISPTSITLSVGTSSIVITPNGITITGTQVTVHGTGSVDIEGDSGGVYIGGSSVTTNGRGGTFLQGGGDPAPPTTVQ